jgi:hypothetical protein
LRRKVIQLAGDFNAQTILIEEAGFGLTLLQDYAGTCHRM